ncbi:MAG TPA: ATP-binding cassette domain-containing protein [Candidatus Elarobacter sp.]|jgi:branched-chain amino acid transport system ATP-binding protein|nr:ATP-binding cassette domain-containing protein [Candidatus Elarobacter sp.]
MSAAQLAAPILEVRSVTVAYAKLHALAGVSLQVGHGEIVGVIGPNGAGKSTLVDVIAGRTAPARGEVLLDGVSTRGLAAFRVARRGIARTFQVAHAFREASVLDSVVVPVLAETASLRAAREHALEMLRLVDLAEQADARAEHLDVAQRKRLQLAQALALRPRLLLLDEIMAGLPPAEIDAFVALVRRINADGTTILVVEHVMRAIQALAGRIVVLHHGEKIADDPPALVFRDPAVMKAYLGPRFEAS